MDLILIFVILKFHKTAFCCVISPSDSNVSFVYCRLELFSDSYPNDVIGIILNHTIPFMDHDKRVF